VPAVDLAQEVFYRVGETAVDAVLRSRQLHSHMQAASVHADLDILHPASRDEPHRVKNDKGQARLGNFTSSVPKLWTFCGGTLHSVR
jgi:hypothetical protein